MVPCTLDEFSDKTGDGYHLDKDQPAELSPEQVYCIYKQRQAVEQFFKTFRLHSLEFNASHMRGIYSMEAWLFLNHLSMTMGGSYGFDSQPWQDTGHIP